MTFNLIFAAVWAFLLRGTLDDPARPFRPAWMILDAFMLGLTVLAGARHHEREVEKARRYPWARP